ncbi:phage Gp37/Gp68 family protein [Nonomuraea sp. NBC_00507]|uniref:DUF5131 family protein n=1 Tax=Nonomuraea sp. NBC_00507 TaxID=2976002 RepID=UPI002E17110A
MTAQTAIEWTETTWNPVTGCDRISPGCDNCYALRLAGRLKAMGQARYANDGDPRTSGPGFAVTCHPAALADPYRWRRARMVFVNSMSDLFHAKVPATFVAEVWRVMANTPQHVYQVLTKRPERMVRTVAKLAGTYGVLPNVWLGTSVEADAYTRRIEYLRRTPAAVRFLSLEPLLEALPSLDLTGIGWVIVGGESGPGHRPIRAEWVTPIRDACVAAEIPFFFKQWGGRTPKAGGRELDGRVWNQFPDHAQRRHT